MLKLYGGTRSRASIVQWYLEELEVPYEFVLLDMQAGEHRQPDFLAINPVGKVPAIVDGEFKLWETGAILMYLAEKYDAEKHDPMLNSIEQRATLAQWVLFANATVGPGIFVEATRERESPRLLGMLNQLFEQHPFVMGDRFGAADVAVGSILAYIPMMLKLGFEDYPAIAQYLERLGERPAFQKAILNRA
jgi:glutathione S-transferase